MLLSPLEEGCGPLFVKIWIPSTQWWFVPNLVGIGPVVLGRVWAFICKNMNSIYPVMLCAKFGGNWPGGSREEDFWIFSIAFTILLLSPLGRGVALYLNKLEIPFIQGCFVLSLDEISVVVLKKKIFQYFQNNFTFSLLSPLEKGVALHLNKLESPPPKDALCQVWLKLVQWFWRRSWKCEKFTDGQTDKRTDRRQTTGDQKRSLELSVQVS